MGIQRVLIWIVKRCMGLESHQFKTVLSLRCVGIKRLTGQDEYGIAHQEQ